MAAALSLRTQYDNLGDEIINAILLKELAQRMPVLALGHAVPDWYLANLRNHLGPAWKNVVCHDDRAAFATKLLRKGLGRARHWLFTACGDVGGTRSHYRRDGMLAMMNALPSLRLASVGASCANLSASKATLLRQASRRGALIGVRDTLSAATLSARGIEAMLVPDLAFKLPWSARPDARRAILSFREVAGQDRAALLPSLAGIVISVRRAGFQPAMTWQVSKDESFCKSLADALGIPAIDCLGSSTGRFERAMTFYDEAALVVSNRLHVLLITAARGGAPFAMLQPGEAKIAPLLSDQGMADCILPANGAGFDRLLDDLPARRQAWQGIFARNCAQLDACFDRLAGAEG
ncbi:polysaccharide pyruvyl transferase family protein [Rhizobium sp. YJ-22]|uniref:polysaccharide pyruvyl transferase family protein n=1 Tax=Rhizobium sp. YJ-22 TaxID=3037556 RepID=UPI002412C9DE|nr:polysaccharide pyruvyl transferase family protein [Rhizobium sp. YJ-22]MDG3574786.1 polysaccharide pyruvyl transferase family protein [Rhizobium sp. YJ-22]